MIVRLLNRTWGLACLPAARRFEQALAQPRATQWALLMALLRRHAECTFGRSHGFASITDPETFRERVPIHGWDDVAPWIERIKLGAPMVLTTDPVIRLVPTGGSSGGVKLVPWTNGLRRDFHAALGPWIADLQHTYPEIVDGPAYWSITPTDASREASSVPIGFDDDCAYLGGPLAVLVRTILATPGILRSIADITAFRYATLRCLLARPDLRFISIWHPSFLHLLMDEAIHHRRRLLADLRDGGISVPLPEHVRRALGPWVRALPSRAAELSHADWSDPRSWWPQLALVSCWGDAAAELPMQALRRRLRGVEVQAKGLLATEGVVSIPWRGAMVAAVCSHVLEFVDGHGRACWLDEVVEGETYDVLITTGGGLWRYRLGDRVRVTGFAGRTPCLRFIGRTKDVCDLVGEKLEEGFVASVFAATLPAARFALLTPNEDGSSGYTLFTDISLNVTAVARLDAALGRNPQWQWARQLGQLAPLRATMVQAGAAERAWIAHRRAHCQGAVKPASLDGDRQWAERFRAEELLCSG